MQQSKPGAVEVDPENRAFVGAPAFDRHAVKLRTAENQRARRPGTVGRVGVVKVVQDRVSCAVGPDFEYGAKTIASAAGGHAVERRTGDDESARGLAAVAGAACERMEDGVASPIGSDLEYGPLLV